MSFSGQSYFVLASPYLFTEFIAMSRNQEIQKRQFYRLRYPKKAQPCAVINGRKFHVCEISEQGMRILFTGDHAVAMGIIVSGSIQFHDGTIVEIEGRTLRQDPDHELIIQLIKGLDLKRMAQEQIYLRAKYPRLFTRTAKKLG